MATKCCLESVIIAIYTQLSYFFDVKSVLFRAWVERETPGVEFLAAHAASEVHRIIQAAWLG